MTVRSPESVLFAYRAGGPFDGATFARTGGGMHRNRLRLLADQANDNVPRVDWVDLDGDGDTETPTLLIEPARTNELTQSEDLTHGDWVSSNLSTTNANQAGDPEGGTTLDELVENTATSWHARVQTSLTLTADANYALSCWAIQGGRDIALALREIGASSTNWARARFDLSDGTVDFGNAGGTGAFVRAYAEDWTSVATGLYRCVLVGSVGNGATSIGAYLHMYNGVTESYTGDGSSNLYAGHVMVEDNVEFATSYIATTTAAATRNGETLRWNFPSPPQPMTVYCRFIERGTRYTTTGRLWHIGRNDNAGDEPRLQIDPNVGAGYRVLFEKGTGGTSRSSALTGTPEYGDTVEIVALLNSDGSVTAYQSINGGAVETGSASGDDGSIIGAAWAADELNFGTVNAGSTPGTHGLRDLFVLKGVLTGSATSIMNQARRTRTAMGSAED